MDCKCISASDEAYLINWEKRTKKGRIAIRREMGGKSYSIIRIAIKILLLLQAYSRGKDLLNIIFASDA